MPSGSVMLILGRHFILVLYCPVAQHCLKASVPFSLSLLITVYIYIYIIGFGDRLLLEMKKITPNSLKIRVNLSLSLYLFICLFFRYLLHKIESTQHGWGMCKNCYFFT